MKRLYLNRALLWKEWQQNRWLFLAAALLMSPLYPIFDYLTRQSSPVTATQIWQRRIGWYGTHFPEFIWLKAVVVLLIGIALLASERRSNTIEFLAAAPVSRREIVVTKYLVGVAFVVIAQLLSFLMLACVSLFNDADVMAPASWYVGTTIVLLTIFSVSFFCATVTGNFLSATGLAVLVSYGPLFLLSMYNNLMIGFLQDRDWYQYIRWELFRWVENLTLFTYLGGERSSLHLLYEGQGWLLLRMTPICIIALALSVICFEKNSFEKNGQWLMFGNPLTIAKVIASLLVALPLFAVVSGGPMWFAVLSTLLVIWLIVRTISAVPRVLRRLGAR